MSCKPCGCRNLPSGPETCRVCVPRAGLPLTLAAVGVLAVAGMVAKRGSAARAEYTGGSYRATRADPRDHPGDPGFPELLCTCGMPESMHGPLEHAFDPAPDRVPENPVGKTYGGGRAVSARDLRRYGMSDLEIRRVQQRGSRSSASSEPLGLDRHPFASYALAREMLDDLGWVETARSVPRGWKRPETVEFFNKYIGGVGRLVAESDDPRTGSYEFFGPENWVGRVLKKRYAEPGDLSGSLSRSRADKKAAKAAQYGRVDATGLPSRRGPKGGSKSGSRSTSFSVSGKPGKGIHPWFEFSAWQSSDHTDKAAARVLSRIAGFDVAKRYAEPGVDPWLWDEEIEGIILHQYGRPPMQPQSGPNLGRWPHGSPNESDAMREALVILEEHPQRVAAAYRAFRKAKGLKAKAWSGMSSGAKATATALLLDNARIARALVR